MNDKYIRIMADYCADACWDRDGCSVSLDDYPLSEATKVRLREWQWFYDVFCMEYDPEAGRTFPDKQFELWGRELAIQVKRELPEYEVMYLGNRLESIEENTKGTKDGN
jgi:hypothetical protein